MYLKFEDYETLARARMEGETAMRRMATQRRRTRMEHRQRRARSIWLATLFLWAFLLTLLLLLLPPRAAAQETAPSVSPEPTVYAEPIGPELPEEEVQEDYENENIEAALLAQATRLDGVTITHYDPCVKCCGKTDGITASGVSVTPYYTVAVDPELIPLGSEVLVDYGDGEIHYYRAEDTGGGVRGKHLDLCVTSHAEALTLGVRQATVWFLPAEG